MPRKPNAYKLTSDLGLAMCKPINEALKGTGVQAHELRWKAEIVLSNGDVLELSEW